MTLKLGEPLLRNLILCACTLPLFCLVQDEWRMDWDSAIYIGIAESIVAGEGVSYQGFTITKYPPGFPALLTPVIAVFGRDHFVLRAFMIGWAILAVFLVERLGRRILPPEWSLAVAVALALCGVYWNAALVIGTEIPALALMAATLTAGIDWIRRPTPWRFLLLLGLGLMAGLLRIASFTALFAVLAAAIAAPRGAVAGPSRRMVGGFAICCVTLVAFVFARDSVLPSTLPDVLPESAKYTDQLFREDVRNSESAPLSWTGLVQRTESNAAFYKERWAAINMGRARGSEIQLPLFLGLLTLAALAATLLIHRDPVAFLAAALVGVHAIWPFHYDRFLLVIVPFAWICLARIPAALLKPRSRTSATVALILVLGLAVTQAGHLSGLVVRDHQRPYGHSELERSYRSTFQALDARLPADAVVLCESGPVGWYLGRRQTYALPNCQTDAAFDAFLARFGVTHVVVAPGWRTTGTFGRWRERNAHRIEPVELPAGTFPTFRLISR